MAHALHFIALMNPIKDDYQLLGLRRGERGLYGAAGGVLFFPVGHAGVHAALFFQPEGGVAGHGFMKIEVAVSRKRRYAWPSSRNGSGRQVLWACVLW